MSQAVQQFRKLRETEGHVHAVVSAIRVMADAVRDSQEGTWMGMEKEMVGLRNQLMETCPSEKLSIETACDLLMVYVQRRVREAGDAFKTLLTERTEDILRDCEEAPHRLVRNASRFIRDGTTVLVMGNYRAARELLLASNALHHQFDVFVAESRVDNSGYALARELAARDIPVTLVLDAAIGRVMRRVDLVLLGADAVVESGGIISSLGTFQTALIASAFKRPVYVAAEFFKFRRNTTTHVFPLSPDDVAADDTHEIQLLAHDLPPSVQVPHSRYEYTPPQYITLIFSDVGVLTPSGISQELIKFYA